MTDQNVSKAAVLDYIYKRRDDTKNIILSGRDLYLEEAKRERAFLEGQLRIICGEDQWRTKLDPVLLRLAHESTLGSLRSGPKETPNAQPKKTPAAPIEQPSYWDECRKMDFGRLRQFIDNSLQETSASGLDGRPRSKEEFLALLEMLRGKIDASDLPETEVQKRRQLRPRRLQIAERVHRDIEQAFKPGVISPTGRLPWRLLPPGELSIDVVRQHYERLQQLNPHIRYERERITKALSLRPEQYYVGTDEFEGYIVLTFAHTPSALLECPIYGNAVYIIDSDWKRLSRMTKQELLTHRLVTRIIHKGDWFWRVKQELGIR